MSRIYGSYGSRIYGSYGSIFNILRGAYTLFSIVAVHLHKCSLLPTSSPTFFCCFFFHNSHSLEPFSSVRWYFTVVVSCISLMISDVHPDVMCLLAISMSSLEKMFILVLFSVLIGLFLVVSYMSSLCILDIYLLSDILFEKSSPKQ